MPRNRNTKYRITISDQYTFDQASKIITLTDAQYYRLKAQQKAMKMVGATGFGKERVYDRSKRKWLEGAIIKFEEVKKSRKKKKPMAKKKATAKKTSTRKKSTAKKKTTTRKKSTGSKVKVKGYTVKGYTRKRKKTKRK